MGFAGITAGVDLFAFAVPAIWMKLSPQAVSSLVSFSSLSESVKQSLACAFILSTSLDVLAKDSDSARTVEKKALLSKQLEQHT